MKTNLPPVKRDQILQLASSHETDQIAEITGIDEDYVLAVLAEARIAVPRRLGLRCNRTGAVWPVSSPRRVYLLAQIKGLIDWSCVDLTAKGAA